MVMIFHYYIFKKKFRKISALPLYCFREMYQWHFSSSITWPWKRLLGMAVGRISDGAHTVLNQCPSQVEENNRNEALLGGETHIKLEGFRPLCSHSRTHGMHISNELPVTPQQGWGIFPPGWQLQHTEDRDVLDLEAMRRVERRRWWRQMEAELKRNRRETTRTGTQWI